MVWQFVLFVAVLVVGVLLRGRGWRLAVIGARASAALLLLLWLIVLASALRADLAFVHRWSAQLLVIGLWLWAPLAIGLTVNPWASISLRLRLLHVLLAAFALPVGLFAAFTGYLDPAPNDAAAVVRFVVWHQIVPPLFLGGLLASWLWASRQLGQRGGSR